VWFLAGRDQQTGNVFGDIDRLSQGKVDQTVTAAVDPPREAASAVMIEGVGLCLLGGQFNDQYFDWWCDRPGAVDRLPKLELPRAGMGVGAIGKTVYAVGGYNASRAINGTNRLDAFTPTP
jgi:Kelch motif protein